MATPRRFLALAAAAVGALSAGTACEPDPVPPPDAETYRQELAAACSAAGTALDALPRPPDQIGVSDFAAEVAAVLDTEAEAARALDVPPELDDDHRAFVANTEDQADRWRDLAMRAASDPATDAASGAAGADAALIGELTTELAEFTLGRDDLATEMGVPECRRDAG